MQKYLNLNSFDVNELLTEEITQNFSYIDLECRGIIFTEEKIQEGKNILRIPFKEELYPYHRAMSEFLYDMNLDVPRGITAKKYLRNKGYVDDFYIYWYSKAGEKLKEWLENQVQSPVA